MQVTRTYELKLKPNNSQKQRLDYILERIRRELCLNYSTTSEKPRRFSLKLMETFR